MEMIQEYMPMIMNGLGGAVLGPIIAKLFRGSAGTGLLGGILGGIGGGFGADAANLGSLISGENAEGMMVYLQNLAEGAAGGGVLGGLIGMVMGRR